MTNQRQYAATLYAHDKLLHVVLSILLFPKWFFFSHSRYIPICPRSFVDRDQSKVNVGRDIEQNGAATELGSGEMEESCSRHGY